MTDKCCCTCEYKITESKCFDCWDKANYKEVLEEDIEESVLSENYKLTKRVYELEQQKDEAQKTIDKLFNANQDMAGDNCELNSIINNLEQQKAELIQVLRNIDEAFDISEITEIVNKALQWIKE